MQTKWNVQLTVLVNVQGTQHLEEIAVALHIRNDLYQVETGINLKEIKRTSQLVSRLTGVVNSTK